MKGVTDRPVRSLTLQDLGLEALAAPRARRNAARRTSRLPDDDPVLASTRRAVELGFAGVILTGPPGTGKSWYAQQVALEMTGSLQAVRSTQFHPSYQYEDFVYGYRANTEGVYEPMAKLFAELCEDARGEPDQEFVLVIDELSRSDVIRVFGEALTYIERDKRGIEFPTASGETMVVPENLTLVCTMNPWDRGVDELDVALERRFAQIDLHPDADVLRRKLTEGKADPGLVDRIVSFFEGLQRERNERLRIGHAYFLRCLDAQAAEDVWNLRLLATIRRAAGQDGATVERLRSAWEVVLRPKTAEEGAPDAGSPAG